MISAPAATPAAVSSTELPRNADGSVNWRATVPAAALYVKKDLKEKAAKLLERPIEQIDTLTAEDVAKLPDSYLVIKKAGILELARKRGYSSAIPEVQSAMRDYVIVRMLITWDPFEGQPTKVTGGIGDACAENTSQLGARYLGPVAANRAFSLAVRNFLEIDIVSSDELGDKGLTPEQESSTVTVAPTLMVGPRSTLEKAAAEGGFTFEKVKNAAQARWTEDSKTISEAEASGKVGPKRRIENDPAAWTTFADIPPRDCTTLIQLIRASIAARKQQQAETAAASVKPTRTSKPKTSAPAAMAEAA